MVRGAFRRFDHDHFFSARRDSTVMRDRFDYESPLGPLGLVADRLFLERYLRRRLLRRNDFLKETAETEEWRRFLPVA
jgi:ligand-binding SRPBCC domain-containing protein